jgi:TolB-like protein/Tfp pilus assembly protein PilF
MTTDDEDEAPTPAPRTPGSSRKGLVRRLLDGWRGPVSSGETPARLGRYRILHRLGQGGMGTVFAAEDESLGRQVALKIITEPDESARKRFHREARAAAGVNHPNVCQVYEIAEDGGQLFLAMELLSGEPLSERIIRGSLPVAEAVSLGDGMLSALEALHGTGIMHRDLKPSNVFLTPHGVKLLDFGLARDMPRSLTRSIETGTQLTEPGLLVGTPRYMAPEQVLGREVDERTDLFAVAAILYEAVAGRPAFLGATVVETLSATLHDDPPTLTGEAAALGTVLRRGLAKDPADRPSTASAMKEELGGAVSGATPAPPEVVATRQSRTPTAPAIAVLPFANLSPDRDQDYFCEGMAEDILNALTRVEGLRVVARASSFRFAGRSHDVRAIGRALDVDRILEGSVRTAGDRLRVTAQLINVEDASHVWSEQFDRQKEDVFAIQDEISARIVEALRIRLVGKKKAEPGERHTNDLEAYHLFLKGKHNWYRRESDSLQKAAAFFEEAVRKDPGYVLAHLGLANAYSSLGFYGMEPARALGKARASVDRALALDDGLGDVHAARGLMQMWLLWDWEGAEQSFGAAIEDDPDRALSRCWYSFLLSSVDRHEEAVRMAESALPLDPLSPYVNTCLGLALFTQGRAKEGIEALDRALEMEPDFLYTLWVLGGASSACGQHDQAVRALEKAATLSERAPYYLGWLAAAYGAAGRGEEAHRIVDELTQQARGGYVSPTFFAWALASLGETETALDHLEKACQEKSPPLAMHQATLLRPLHSEPRYREVRRRMGLKPL